MLVPADVAPVLEPAEEDATGLLLEPPTDEDGPPDPEDEEPDDELDDEDEDDDEELEEDEDEPDEQAPRKAQARQGPRAWRSSVKDMPARLPQGRDPRQPACVVDKGVPASLLS
jgi:hypothetical protein